MVCVCARACVCVRVCVCPADQVIRYHDLGGEVVLARGVGGAIEAIVHPVGNVVLLIMDGVLEARLREGGREGHGRER